MSYSAIELMICCAARELEDGRTVAVGTGVPCAAAMLAQRTHAPNLVVMFEAGGVAPQLPTMPISVGDSRTFYRGLMATSMADVMQFAQRGMIDYTFLGGAQIDAFGNLNSTVIGDHGKPKVRFPGSGGACDLASLCWRTMVVTQQNAKRFVEKLDFLTSPGYLTGPGAARGGGAAARLGPAPRHHRSCGDGLCGGFPADGSAEPASGNHRGSGAGGDRISARIRRQDDDNAAADRSGVGDPSRGGGPAQVYLGTPVLTFSRDAEALRSGARDSVPRSASQSLRVAAKRCNYSRVAPRSPSATGAAPAVQPTGIQCSETAPPIDPARPPNPAAHGRRPKGNMESAPPGLA